MCIRDSLIGADQMRSVERAVMLQVVDSRWKDHLLDMDYLQEGIHLRALGQRDPLVEYKGEGFDLFQDMMEGVKSSTVTTLMKNSPEDLAVFTAVTLEEPLASLTYTPPRNVAAGGGKRGATTTSTGPVVVQQRVVYDKVGRNDPCPCGSGKKYKKCHG